MDVIQIAKPDISEQEKLAVMSVLDSGCIVQGEKVAEFEKQFANYMDVKYAVATSSGTTALHLAYKVAGLDDMQTALTTPFSFVATKNMLALHGSHIVYSDINEKDFNINPSLINRNEHYDLIVPVHLFGKACDMGKIMEIAKDNGSKVVEDACQSCGTEFDGKKVGTFGDIGVFSHYGTKNLVCGEGGMCITKNKVYADEIKELRNHALNNKKYAFGYNYRMTDIEAAIGLVQLAKLDDAIKTRRSIANIYNSEFKGLVENLPDRKNHSFNNYSFCIESRDKFIEFMRKDIGVDCRVYYPEPFADLPKVSEISKKIVSIPIRPNLKVDEVDKIVDGVKMWLRKSR